MNMIRTVAISIVVAVVAGCGVTEDSPDSSANPSGSSVADERLSDLEYERRLIGMKEPLLAEASETFAGVWFEQGPFVAYVAFTANADARAEELRELYGAPEEVLQAVDAEFNYQTLLDTLRRIADASTGNDEELGFLEGADFTAIIDWSNNRLIVISPDARLGASLASVFPPNLVGTEVGATPTTVYDN